ncbi:uncharacterized protein LOC134835197 [Culicoides brevitarsis]|uniref:uncharacterized protein LOC134835197 n=1 Tax=Culicoides brevitarsis TaxID=469753 RepID=UPI00307C8E25
MSNLEKMFVPTKCENLMDLNDDCLLYLLSFFKHFELMDLRGFCRRLDDLIFQSRSRFVTLDFKNRFKSLDDVLQALEIIKFLGPVVKSLNLGCLSSYWSIKYIEDKSVIFDCINEHCVSLETFDPGYVDFKDFKAIQKFAPIVKRLKSLILNWSDFDDSLGDCLKGSSLEELRIDNNPKITENFFKNVANLKSLHITSHKNLTSDSYINILSKNLKLKKLTIFIDDFTFFNSEILVTFIAKNLQELEELSFDVFANNVSLLGELPNLKKLEIVQDSEVFTEEGTLYQHLIAQEMEKLLEKLSQRNIIEELYINASAEQINFDLLSNLTNLKKLSLDKCYGITKMKNPQGLENLETLTIEGVENVSDLLNLINPLKKLKLLDIQHNSVKFEFFNKLIQILKTTEKRPKLKVSVKIICVDQSADKFHELLKSNQDFIDVEYIRFFEFF